MSNQSKGLVIALTGVQKRFVKGGEEIVVLHDLDLQVGSGESVTILGASGSGKSTLLYLIGTLEKPDAGKLLIDGETMYEKTHSDLARFRNQRLGFVFQFHHLLKDFNALENVAMPLLVRGESRLQAMEKSAAMLQRVGLSHRLQHRPGELSGGEQQRVAIARAMVSEPQLLLADEPTGNLDRNTGEQIQDLLLELNQRQGCTLVIVTHNETFAKKTNRTVWLRDGKITNTPLAH